MASVLRGVAIPGWTASFKRPLSFPALFRSKFLKIARCCTSTRVYFPRGRKDPKKSAERSKKNTVKPADAAKLKALEDELKMAAEAMTDWQRRLRLRNPHLAGLRFPEPVTAEQIQRVLKQQ
ncbi:MAG: hypothetical protein ABI977_27415 [Acidobacteriota bacterium]